MQDPPNPLTESKGLLLTVRELILKAEKNTKKLKQRVEKDSRALTHLECEAKRGAAAFSKLRSQVAELEVDAARKRRNMAALRADITTTRLQLQAHGGKFYGWVSSFASLQWARFGHESSMEELCCLASAVLPTTHIPQLHHDV